MRYLVNEFVPWFKAVANFWFIQVIFDAHDSVTFIMVLGSLKSLSGQFRSKTETEQKTERTKTCPPQSKIRHTQTSIDPQQSTWKHNNSLNCRLTLSLDILTFRDYSNSCWCAGMTNPIIWRPDFSCFAWFYSLTVYSDRHLPIKRVYWTTPGEAPPVLRIWTVTASTMW